MCYNPGSILHFGCFDWEACGTYAPWPGMEPACPEVEAQRPSHWASKEIPPWLFSIILYLKRHAAF